MIRFLPKHPEHFLFTILTGSVLYGASMEFYNIAWGTGVWLGEFSLTWFVFFVLFVILCVLLFFTITLMIWQGERFTSLVNRLITFREKWRGFRWLGLICFLVFPVWLLQYTILGIVFSGLYIRIVIWSLDVLLLAIILTGGKILVGWNEFLATLILTSGIFSVATSLKNITGYPFSLGWSEGNRIWDYSVRFGRDLYDYHANQYIPVLLDPIRQLIGGLPFLIPGLTLWMERLWIGLTQILPYFFVGLAAFRFSYDNKRVWVLMILWTFLFLKQGPIHASLVVAAAMVALAWRSSLWISIPLLVFSGYFAQASRFSWLLAPGIWIVMLEFSFASLHNGKLSGKTWIRAVSLGLAGVFGGYLMPKVLSLFSAYGLKNLSFEAVGDTVVNSGVTTSLITQQVTHQPLLWYRLFPNSTYESGILFGLLVAVGPLLVILFYLAIKKEWHLHLLQKLAIILPLMAFLFVGLIVSTKIGGGGDLHNMDMFLIGLSFTTVIAFYNGGVEWIYNKSAIPMWIRFMLVLSLSILAFAPLSEMRSYNFGEQSSWLATLKDAPNENALDMLPTQEVTRLSLQIIQDEVDRAKLHGDVLFIDQRQLLTFGYIRGVKLMPEYEKKLLMNEAMSADPGYFDEFYSDLASKRFALIISEILRTPIRDSSYEFGEENNAWVKWVANPILCYYEPRINLKEVGVQLLVPKTEPVDCSAELP